MKRFLHSLLSVIRRPRPTVAELRASTNLMPGTDGQAVGAQAEATRRTQAWVFVSHSSQDLRRVRQVRNYLEEKGASPLLFHLIALTNPEQFWPLIEREIAARNFFLYCDSKNAQASEWVSRERAAVEGIAQSKPIRIGHVRVDEEQLDHTALDSFLAKTRIFPIYAREDHARVRPFLDQLAAAGFQVFSELYLTVESYGEKIEREIEHAAVHGWIVAFMSKSAILSHFVNQEIAAALVHNSRFITVLLENVEERPLGPTQIDATIDWATAPKRLAEELLSKSI